VPVLQKSRFCVLEVTAEQENGMEMIDRKLKGVNLKGYLYQKLGSKSAASHAYTVARMWLFMHGPLACTKKLYMVSALGDAGWEGFIALLGKEAYEQLMILACGHTVNHVEVEQGSYTSNANDLRECEVEITRCFGRKAWDAGSWGPTRNDPCYVLTDLTYL